MKAIEAILTRRSVRLFTDQEVAPELVTELLKAAMSAPSARNQQPWHFMVINERELLDKIPTVHPYAKMCLQAPLTIIPCIEPALAKSPKYLVEDMSAASQNILIAARALGLGAVWLGVYPDEERIEGLQGLLELPKTIVPFNVIPIGYSKITQKGLDRYKESRVHYNNW